MIFIGRRDPNLGVKKRTIERRFSFGPNSIKIIVVIILAAFSLFYLSQSSQSAKRNYTISDLDQQKKDLNAERDRLEVEANRLKALSLIQSKAEERGMEQVTK